MDLGPNADLDVRFQVESNYSLSHDLHPNASVERGPSAQGALIFDHGENSRPGLEAPNMSPPVPYALTWTEHEMELRPMRPLKRSDHPVITPDVFPRRTYSCTAIANASGEFIIFGGEVMLEGKKISTNDVFLLSTADMSLTGLETDEAKPKVSLGHGAVISGRVLVIFGGSDDDYLHFLNLGECFLC